MNTNTLHYCKNKYTEFQQNGTSTFWKITATNKYKYQPLIHRNVFYNGVSYTKY